MTDEQAQTTPQTEQTEQTQQTSGEAWREVGQQFQALGESLASAFRVAWQRGESRQYLQEMQTGLETMANRVSEAVQETVASPEAEKVRTEVEKGIQSARAAGEQTLQEVQPHLLSALRQANVEMQKLISRLEGESSAPETPVSDEESND